MKLEHEADVSVAEVRELLLVQSPHVHSVNHYLPAVRRVERTDYLEQCGLSRTARSHDAHHLSFVYMQVDALEHLQRAEALCDILYVDHCLLYCRFIVVFRFLPWLVMMRRNVICLSSSSPSLLSKSKRCQRSDAVAP